MILISPLSLFLYTWRFLKQLELEANRMLKRIYKWFALVSIVLLPLAFYVIVIVLIVEIAKFQYYQS